MGAGRGRRDQGGRQVNPQAAGQGEQAGGIEHLLGEIGEAPEGIEEQLDDPERDEARARETQQPGPGLLMDQFELSDEKS